MQTNFDKTQLADPAIQRSNEILRSCVHCGFCTATCPTYKVLGDELDSPRGRIYLIKDMLENSRVPDEKTVSHIDRCLSCLSCMTTCPSGVHYMHLIDHAREYVETHYRRPIVERALRWILAQILPYPGRFRLALRSARLLRPIKSLLPDARLRAMLDMVPEHVPAPSQNDRPQVFRAAGERRKRVALLTGCAQRALNTDINDATIRLLTRHGCEVVIPKGLGCCGAITHHMGKAAQSHAAAATAINAFTAEIEREGLDAIVINTSGCGTTVKDYAHMFRDDPLAGRAARVAALAKDITELMNDLGGLRQPLLKERLRVGYHAACSLQHGQQIKSLPKDLLKSAGFEVFEPKDAHICCGSAGTYNLMQPAISAELRTRKVKSIELVRPDVICAGNIGCMVQIGSGTDIPLVHTVELLDWATGGPRPRSLPSAGPQAHEGGSR
ncbi:glycolate oxidase subunit GlcF [Rhizobium phaseoli]|uniref:glycolate oxidase subunit GlcF n=1 Tax=Rhizobium phaseoli TaxID=396 RepID=UPI000BBB4470|nr:glycolate oxidase subunit GlcF [Rhizobium phaseoli]MDK4730624.1 glycolate oxidase subunit GlcF [Rhizobium phaseoli]NKE91892.1 glycolate oxidase subunit GlcF [Rhizobium phaseoli]PCD64029.1 glycolate oxidase iron-sulfur subunit [Rhizobium phaseoli]